jgi:hypothetical protein
MPLYNKTFGGLELAEEDLKDICAQMAKLVKESARLKAKAQRACVLLHRHQYISMKIPVFYSANV